MVKLVHFAACVNPLVPQVALNRQEGVALGFDSYLSGLVIADAVVEERGCVIVNNGFHLFHSS